MTGFTGILEPTVCLLGQTYNILAYLSHIRGFSICKHKKQNNQIKPLSSNQIKGVLRMKVLNASFCTFLLLIVRSGKLWMRMNSLDLLKWDNIHFFLVYNTPVGKRKKKKKHLALSKIIFRSNINLIRHPSFNQAVALKNGNRQKSKYRVYSLLPRFRKLTNKFTASGLQAQASLEKSRMANFNFWQDMTGEEKQTSWKWVEPCTFWITFCITFISTS